MDRPTGLRERKKEAVRQSLHEAALRLTVEQGLEHVTVEAIADAAQVSRRTFSNYFSGKEEALFYQDRVRARRFLDLLHERPPGEDPRTALLRATEQQAELTADDDPTWLALRRLLRGRPGLTGHRAAAYASTERDLAAEIGRRLPPPSTDDDADLQARVLAATYLAALRIAVESWLDHPERPRAEFIARALEFAHL